MNKKAETMRDRRLQRDEEKLLLDAALQKMNTPEHQFVGPLLHDCIIDALELCCRRGEMLLIQNKRVNRETHQIGIPGATAKDKENRRIPFNPEGRLAAILKRRAKLDLDAYVFGSASGEYQSELQTARETLRLLAHGIEPRPTRSGAAWNREQLQRIDLRWHDFTKALWTAPQFVSPARGDSRADVLAPACGPRAGGQHVHSADAEGADANEHPARERHQRPEWTDWATHCSRDPRRRTRSAEARGFTASCNADVPRSSGCRCTWQSKRALKRAKRYRARKRLAANLSVLS